MTGQVAAPQQPQECPARTRREFGGRAVMLADQAGTRPGGPPILFVNGCSVSGALWEPVLRLLGGERRITFDRPGLAGTPWPGELPTLAQETRTLTELVEWIGAPVVLVAHSMASFHAEALARLRPDLVAAMVMVDGSVEWLDRPPRPGRLWPAKAVHRMTSVPPLHRLGGVVHRLGISAQTAQRLSPRVSERLGQLYSDPDSMAMGLAEASAYLGQAWELLALRGAHPMPSLPVQVLSATKLVPRWWCRTQRRWSRLLGGPSGMSEQVDVAGSRHMMMLDRPDAIVQAIEQVRSTLPR